ALPIYLVAGTEQVFDGHGLADLVVVDAVDPELTQGRQVLGGLGQVLELARFGVGSLLGGLGPELDGRVAVALGRAQARDGIRLDGDHAHGHHRPVVLEHLRHPDLAADQSDRHHILISMSTPAARLRRIRASPVFELGSRMSTSRLWGGISKCSRESLSMNGERNTVNFSMRVGSGTGPSTSAPVRCAVSTICAADWATRRGS